MLLWRLQLLPGVQGRGVYSFLPEYGYAADADSPSALPRVGPVGRRMQRTSRC